MLTTDPKPGLKLTITNDDFEVEIRDQDGKHIASVWISESVPTVTAESRRLAKVIVAALTADAGLGDPPCECCTKEGTEPYWHQECDCMNQGDLADAAGWCAEANLLGRKSDAEKEERGG